MRGHITEEEINKLKLAYPNTALYKWPTPPDNKHDIIFRTLKKTDIDLINGKVQESLKLSKPLPVDEINQIVFERCVVWPEFDIKERMSLPLGWIPSASKAIQEKSGYVDVDINNRVLGPDLRSRLIQDFDYWEDLSVEDLKNLKERYSVPLYKIIIDSKWIFVLRPMTRLDLQVASSANDEEISLVQQIVVWPLNIDWSNIPTGIVDLIGKKGNEISGWAVDSVDVEEI
jgi:hypothetical protein